MDQVVNNYKMKTQYNPKSYIFSIAAVLLLITTSLQIYLPIFDEATELYGMFFFNVIGIFLVHQFCDRESLNEFIFSDVPFDVKIIFITQLLISIQLIIFDILYLFFNLQRTSSIDLVLLTIIQLYLLIMGNRYLNPVKS
jgi:hypothetical protein